MQLCGLTFLYLFLPCAILLSILTPAKKRAVTLLAVSLAYYFLADPKFLLLAVGVVLYDWVMAWLLERARGFLLLRRIVLFTSVFKSVGLIALYGVLREREGALGPLGLTVIGLTSAGYVIDCYFGWARWEKSPVAVGLMSLFFPKLYAGPLVNYNRIVPQLRELRMRPEQIGKGAGIFLRGLTKKVLLGDTLYRLFLTLRELPPGRLSTLSVWTLVVTLALLLYYLLSGLCDMARGLAGIFGFELPDNFSYPYRSKSVTEFLARFNGTVNRFLRRYLFAHLGGEADNLVSSLCNLALLCILAGLWFGIRLNYLLWGVCMTLFVLFERHVLQKRQRFIAPLFRWAYCMAAVLVCFAFFAGDTISQSLGYLAIMFGLGNTPGINSTILYLLASNHLILIVAAFCASGLVDAVARITAKRLPRFYGFAQIVTNFILLGVSTAYLL